MSVMMYKHPGKHKLHGDKFDYIVVEEDDVVKYLKQKWHLTTAEAKKNSNTIDVKEKKKPSLLKD